MKRLLDPADLPSTLWDPESGILYISPTLATAYTSLITRHGLENLAQSRSGKSGPTGGQSADKADEHFAQQFDGSSARVQLALLDPKRKMTPLTNGILKMLAGDKLAVMDAPCGAGAATLAVLGAVVELRAKGVLPREPLDVQLIGRELSYQARNYASELLTELQPHFEQQAVFVEADFDSWDATCEVSTAEFVKCINITSQTYTRMLLLVANFSDFLTSTHNWKQAKPQLGQLFLHASGESNFAAWIEPKMNKVTNESGGLFANLRKLITEPWKKFASESSESGLPKPVATSSAKFALPLNPEGTARVHLAVMPINLVRHS